MKVAYVMETLTIHGGLERVMVSKMNYLADVLGYDVTLIEVYEYQGEDAYSLSGKVCRRRLGIRKTAFVPFKVWTFYKVVREVRRQISLLKPDVMMSAGLLGVMLYGLSSYPCRTVFESHQARSTMPLPFLLRRLERNVDAVVCLTHGDASEYSIARNVSVIPNMNTLLPATPYRHERSKDVITVGRLSKQKGYDFLLDVWRDVSTKLPGYRLVIYGEGRERKTLERKICTLHLQDSVVLYGNADNMDKVYRSADLVVLTSVFEGYPMVILEALAYGVPVVSADICYGPRELLGDGKGGILVPRNIKAFSAAISKVLTEHRLYDSLSKEALSLSEKNDIGKIMGKWDRFFRDMTIEKQKAKE